MIEETLYQYDFAAGTIVHVDGIPYYLTRETSLLGANNEPNEDDNVGNNADIDNNR